MSKVINTVGGGSSGGGLWELLWTNPNPTSAFAAQTIPLDLSNVQEVNLVIQHDLGGSADWHYTIPQMVSAGKQAFVAVQGVGSSGTIGAIRRVFIVSATGVEFEVGLSKTGTSAPSENNSVGIPLQIYGR